MAEKEMSAAEKAARAEQAEKKMQDATEKAYTASRTTPLRKGGFVKAADGIATKGKTRGRLV